MFTKIKKRDGKVVTFNPQKISIAIYKAGRATGEFGWEVAESLCRKVIVCAESLLREDIPTVEQIQDIVEEVLLESPYRKTAKAYILYREQHAQIREIISKGNLSLIDNYLNKVDWQVNENSNMTFSLQGLNNYICSEITKTYWLNKIYPENIRQAALSGDFHIHDLGLLSVYCVGWDLLDLLYEGFCGVEGKVESRPPKHLGSALGQVVNFFYTLQGEAAGAQAFSNFDTLLAPFIRFDNLNYQQVKQALQEFIFNLNVPTRVGFQTPFTNITLDLTPPKTLADHPVVIGGKELPYTYKEFQEEIRLFNRALMEVMLEGDAKGRVFTFPIPTYNITKYFDWEAPELEPLWQMTAKYGIPYFSNFISSEMDPEDVRSMCCRLRLDTKTLKQRGGGLFGANPLTGSIGVVTINMPRLGYLAQTEEEFFDRLDKLLHLAKESLQIKRKMLEKFTDAGLFPYSKFYLRNTKKRFNCYWKNHFSTIGLVGLNECCLNLFGENLASKRGLEFAEKVLDFIRMKLIDFQMQTGDNYNLEATPAESTAYRLAKLDKQKFPDIICANEAAYQEGHEPFYTNSSQLPVDYTDDIFHALTLQEPLQKKYTGGTVMHLFIGERIEDPNIVKNLIKKIFENFSIPYLTITPTFSICSNHGYISGRVEFCPKCGSETEVYSRTVGYLRPVKQWNKGKQEEFLMRKTFNVNRWAT